MGKAASVREQILDLLKRSNGHIDGSNHRTGAAGVVRDEVGEVSSSSQLSRILKELEDEEVIWSEWRHARLRDHIYDAQMWERKETPAQKRERLVGQAKDQIDSVLAKLSVELFDQASDDVWVEEAIRLEDEVTRLRELNIELERLLEQAKKTISEQSETINRLNNDVRTVRGSFEAYKDTVKKVTKNSTSVKQAERTLNEAIASIQREHRDFSFSNHARHRMKEMELTEADVIKVVSNPDVVHDSRHNDQSNLAYKKGELTVIVSRTDGTVITVLWNKVEQWTREEFLERNA